MLLYHSQRYVIIEKYNFGWHSFRTGTLYGTNFYKLNNRRVWETFSVISQTPLFCNLNLWKTMKLRNKTAYRTFITVICFIFEKSTKKNIYMVDTRERIRLYSSFETIGRSLDTHKSLDDWRLVNLSLDCCIWWRKFLRCRIHYVRSQQSFDILNSIQG